MIVMRVMILLGGISAKLWKVKDAPSWGELWREFRHPDDAEVG